MFIFDTGCHSIDNSTPDIAPSEKPEELKKKKQLAQQAIAEQKAPSEGDGFEGQKILCGSDKHKSLVDQATQRLKEEGLLPRALDVWQENPNGLFTDNTASLFFFNRQQQLLDLLREAMAIRWKMEKENREIEQVFTALVFSASNPIGAIKSLKNLIGSLTSAAALSLAGSSISGLASFAAKLAIKRAKEDPNFAKELFAALNSPMGSSTWIPRTDVVTHFHPNPDAPHIEKYTEALSADLQGARLVDKEDGSKVVEKNSCEIACIEKNNLHGHGEKVQTSDGKFLGFLHRFNEEQTHDKNTENSDKVEKTLTIDQNGFFENHVIVISESEQQSVRLRAQDAERAVHDSASLAKSAENDARRIHQERQEEIEEAKAAKEVLKKLGKYSPEAYELNKKIANA